MLSGCKHTKAAAASEGRRCVVCPALGRESERVVGGGEAKEERRLVLGVQAGTGAQQVHSSPRRHQQTFPLTEKGISGVGRLLSCHTPLPTALSPSSLSPDGGAHHRSAGQCRKLATRGALQGLFVHKDFPSARPGFPNPPRPILVKVRAYLSSAAHPAR